MSSPFPDNKVTVNQPASVQNGEAGLKELEPPYLVIKELLREGKVVVFLGAGVNSRRPPEAEWKPNESNFLPRGSELSKYLARQCSFPSDEKHDLEDLAKVSSYYSITVSRSDLRQRLRKIFKRNFELCDIHTYLASINTPLLIVTTNYDDLTETAFKLVGRPYDLVVYPTDSEDAKGSVLWWKHGEREPKAVTPNTLHIDLKTTTVIYKMHGTLCRPKRKWDSYVITEEDYVDFLSRMTGHTAVPAIFMPYFRTRHFLFLGYGLNDWNLRVVLRNLRDVLPSKRKSKLDDVIEQPLLAAQEAAEKREEAAGEAATPEELVAEEQDDDYDEEDEEDEEDISTEFLSSWAIKYRPTLLERALWDARGIKIYNADIAAFVKRLQEEVMPESPALQAESEASHE
ncbi:MAG: hypothetical protein AUG51_05630 [Acidobacteria bacterium 13_1_20CM_3_53_8]|nr:MAG: hypothetical protein AUG51_05630 [Acidobacteria bacterium 13_1_20CM_3_53_8]